MRMIKRLLVVVLTVVLIFTATSCGNKSNKDSSRGDTLSKATVKDTQTESPLLWRATDKEGRIIWLFGTIHIGNKQSKKVLKRLQPYLEQCDALAVEFDIIAYSKDLEAQKRDVMEFLYDDGTTVSDHISEELYEKLVDFLTESKSYFKFYDNYKLGFWSQLVSQALISKSGLSTNKAMDKLLIDEAYSADREILEVESASFQNDLIVNTPDEYYVIDLDYSIDNADQYAESFNELYEVWLSGNEKKLYTLLMEEDLPEGLTEEQEIIINDFNEKLLTERNIGMAKKATEYIKSGKTVFFAVGAAHFLGNDGIISLLEDEGYKIERVTF